METLATLLQHTAEQYGSTPALMYKPGSATEIWSYTHLNERANRAAVWLRDHGVSKGDRIIIWSPNNPSWVAAYFGAVRIGAIVVPLDVRSSVEFAERVAKQTEPKLVLASKATAPTWNYPAPSFMLEEIGALPESDEQISGQEVTLDDTAVLMFTSGTTGTPKGVILTHRNIMSNVEAVDKLVPDISHFRLVSLLPLSHMFEQTIGLVLALKRGGSVYYISTLIPAKIFEAFKEQGTTAMLLVPQALQLFMSSIEREVEKQGKEKQWRRLQLIARFLPYKMRRLLFRPVYEKLGGKLEFLVSGGAPLPPDLFRKWDILGIPIMQGYGATEAAPCISVTSIKERNPYTVGRAVMDMQIKLAEDSEILIKGPNITPGYWRNPEATEQAFADGWYKTGDLGVFEKNGHLRIQGRKKDLIVLPNGQNVYPQDVEQELLLVPGVADAVVVGLPIEDGAQVYAVLIAKEGAQLDPDAAVKQANSRLAPHQYIRGATVWPDKDFPRTHTLKVKKNEVLASIVAIRAAEKEPVLAVKR
ncbi:MAG: AMP-binding protein [Chloroflexia bacterium]